MNIFPSRKTSKRSGKNSRGASARVSEMKVKKKIKFPKKIFITLVFVGLAFIAAINFNNLVETVNTQKVEYVVIDGKLDYVAEDEVKLAVFGFVGQSLVAINLEEIRKVLEDNPWVKSVNIQREWPSTLIIKVEEELAIARWGKDQLLNQEGQLFAPKTMLNQTHLPYLSGPEGTQFMVMEQYQKFNSLLYPHGLKIADLALNSRGAWSIALESGAKINVGNNLMMERMARLVDSLDSMFIENLATINTIDLRYKNGIAISKNKEIVSL